MGGQRQAAGDGMQAMAMSLSLVAAVGQAGNDRARYYTDGLGNGQATRQSR